MTDFSIADDLNLHDSEVEACLKILAQLQVKYAKRPATFENLVSLSNEAMDKFEKAGFIATISVFEQGMPKLPPEITIQSRVSAKEFDPERQQWEVKKEVASDQQVKDFLKKGGTKDQTASTPEAIIDAPEVQTEE